MYKLADTTYHLAMHVGEVDAGDSSGHSKDGLVTEVTAIRSDEQSAPVVGASNRENAFGWMDCLCVAIPICIGIVLWKKMDELIREMRNQIKIIDEAVQLIAQVESKTDSLSYLVKCMLSQVSLERENISKVEQVTATESQAVHPVPSNNATRAPEPIVQLRYATLQAPDGNGVLRFAERSMTETPSSEKMFKLELNMETGKGTYRINTDAMSMILGDLQLFQSFVKPFSFKGSLSSVTIRDKKPGIISKSGNFWLVDERLEIEL
ncbi:MAG: hypothetical protein LUC91_00595 [Prevotella sp.]|nr:hypothetical protein [Prevotella sp.]